MIEKLGKEDGQSMDIVESNITQLKEIFPEVFAEGKIDFEKLQALLGKYVNTDEDHYNFTWHGKRRAARLSQTPSTGTLRPCKEESVDWDTTQNLFIEGDNLEVLKLLQKSYHRQVKMIYIDPPYNTGNDFVYEDDFKDGVKHYLEMTGQLDSDGKKISTNSSSAGRYHTNWLNMMYPRLKLARNLLRDDGVIFISLDDNEVHNLRKICDEIFGEENFVAHCSVISNPRGRQSDTFVANVHDSLIIYSKSSFKAKIFGAPLSEEQKKEFNLTDEDGEKYRLLGLRQRGAASNREDRPEMYFPIYVDPKSLEISLTSFDGWEEVLPKKSDGRDGRWMWGKEKCQNDKHRLVAKLIEHRNQHDIFVKDYLNRGDEERTRKFKSLWDSKNYNNQVGTQEVKALLDSDLMSFPKSRLLIEDICLMGSDSNDLILDFFAGSATTAHAVMSLNSAMSGKRKYILVQLPEPINDDKSSKSARFKTIADISKYRIKKASQKIREENPLFAGDLGFKVFKLDTSNIKPWDAGFETLENDLIGAVDYIKQDRSNEDVLYELLLKYGLDLTVPIETRTIGGKTIYSIGMGALIVCLDKDVSMETIEGIGKLKEELTPEIMRVVFKDNGFKDDVVKTNAIQTLKRFGIEDIKSL